MRCAQRNATTVITGNDLRLLALGRRDVSTSHPARSRGECRAGPAATARLASRPFKQHFHKMSPMADSIRPALQVLHRHSGDPARVRRLGPYAIESLISEAEEGAGTVYRVRIEPRQRTSISYHRVAEEYYFVLAGHGTALIDGREKPLAPGDFLRLPPGTRHAFVTGDEPLDLLDIHTPGCRPQRDTFFVDAVPDGFKPS
jgi:mannose-6-phosphate isomerase-like protein (cupin superfamily)